MNSKPFFFIKFIIAFVAIAFVLVNLYALAVYRNYLFAPPGKVSSAMPVKLPSLATVYGNVSYVYYDNYTNGYTVLLSHGNAVNLEMMRQEIEQYRKAGFNVMAYDYNGYGQSTGRPSVTAILADVSAVYRYLTKFRKVRSSSIILVGHSLGTAPSSYLASKERVKGVVLVSPFLSVFRAILPSKHSWFFFDPLNNQKWVHQINVPLAIIHGTKDKVISYRSGKLLFESANEPKLFMPVREGGHNDIPWEARLKALNWVVSH